MIFASRFLPRSLSTIINNSQRSSAQRIAVLAATSVGLGFGAMTLWPRGGPTTASAVTDLPVYTKMVVSTHTTPETGIWVTYKDHVYDITNFVDSHPGGRSKITMAAGKAIDPFWAVYQVHIDSKDAHELLESMKIGRLAPEDVTPPPEGAELNHFDGEPERSPLLNIRSRRPFNAEPPLSLLGDEFHTPNSIFFVRNHLPVPNVDDVTYRLRVDGAQREISLTVAELREKYEEHTISATMQCAGNRRTGLSTVKTVRGLEWGPAAISTAKWTGVLLRDVLLDAGCDGSGPARHVEFEGLDKDMSGDPYRVSIPIEKAMSADGDVLLAYEMNGETLPRDHGYPLRVVVPGVAGARNAKWLARIRVRETESDGFWQREDYKLFAPSSSPETVDYATAPAIQETPVQSAITEPANGSDVDADDEVITVRGYAFSGGGRGIDRVDVTIDGGRTWRVAELDRGAGIVRRLNRNWAWTLWEVDVPISAESSGSLAIACRAVDSANNTQPEKGEHVWNFRGLLNNSWHRVEVNVKGGEN